MIEGPILITGGYSGLGFECTKALLKKGFAVIIAGRNLEEAEKAKTSLMYQTGNNNIEVLELDLASLDNIRKSVEKLNTPLYGLICNAGVSVSEPSRTTRDGFEETFGINHLGHFLLTNLIINKFNDTLKRIVMVSSELHNPQKSRGIAPPPEFSSVLELAFPNESRQNKKNTRNYVNSKLANIMFTYALHDKLQAEGFKSILVNAISPGFVPNTGLNRYEPTLMRFMLQKIFPKLRFMIPGLVSPEHAGKYIAKLVSDVTVSGRYFNRDKEVDSSTLSYDKKLQVELWEESAKLVRI